MTLTLDMARQIVSAARAEAERLSVNGVMAVVDNGAHLVAFERMDGAWIGSIQIAIDKAYTAKAFDMPTTRLGEVAQAGGPVFGIHNSNGGRVIIFRGGIPIEIDGQIVGAIGVSGGVENQDVDIAEAGLATLGEASSSLPK